mgnify:CR=1 FL=1
MEEIHKKTSNGIGHNSNILKDKSPTAEAVEEQLFKVGQYIDDITGKFFRILDQVRGSQGDEIVVNPHEREENKPDWHRVVRKATKYERSELHFDAKAAIENAYNRLTHLHLNIDSFINGNVKEVTDKQRPVQKEICTTQADDTPRWTGSADD